MKRQKTFWRRSASRKDEGNFKKRTKTQREENKGRGNGDVLESMGLSYSVRGKYK